MVPERGVVVIVLTALFGAVAAWGNGAATIRASIEAPLAHSCGDFDLIVSDNRWPAPLCGA